MVGVGGILRLVRDGKPLELSGSLSEFLRIGIMNV
jgi:hypothetical protein